MIFSRIKNAKLLGGKMDKFEKEEILEAMRAVLSDEQYLRLGEVLQAQMDKVKASASSEECLKLFQTAKKVEGCSEKSLKYYKYVLEAFFKSAEKPVQKITTDDIRQYLEGYLEKSKAGKVSLDNIRRILSSFFSWLEEEDYIRKNPVKRIHKIKAIKAIKQPYTDENIECLKDSCSYLRNQVIIELLASTGMRVGELVTLKRSSIDFDNKECVVLGKGGKQRKVYFDSKTKLHLKNYLASRTDINESLFVSLFAPFNTLQISGVEIMLRKLGRKANIENVHPHRFRRTLATKAIGKGMPVEQVQILLGHTKIDTTMHYAIVDQLNVKNSYRRYIG